VATELCRGTLFDYVTNKYKRPKFEGEWEILFQVTKGLAYVHELGIVHRDIKPSNILIFVPPVLEVVATDEAVESIKPQIKLADFSISKAHHVEKKDFVSKGVLILKGISFHLDVYLLTRLVVGNIHLGMIQIKDQFVLKMSSQC